jgi:hypothetical protein
MKSVSLFAVPFAALVLGLVAPAAGEPKVVKVAPPSPPVDISASYQISLNGFNLGGLTFNARIQNGTYTADSDVHLSALLGAFKWHGVTRTTGTFAGAAPQPQGYSFEYDGSARSGSVEMGFTGKDISAIKVLPLTFAATDTIPVERQHLKGALDPLSAIITLVRGDAAAPCAKKLAIFDGRQRFELALSQRRIDTIGTTSSGEPVTAVVCRVKYTPIAGYRPNAETAALAANNGIEIAFRRHSGAGLLVPHRVVLPTMAGDAVIEAEKVSIDTPRHGAIAAIDE